MTTSEHTRDAEVIPGVRPYIVECPVCGSLARYRCNDDGEGREFAHAERAVLAYLADYVAQDATPESALQIVQLVKGRL